MEWTDPNIEKGSSKVTAAVTGEKQRRRENKVDRGWIPVSMTTSRTAQQAISPRNELQPGYTSELTLTCN
jgi:hypothetical protein